MTGPVTAPVGAVPERDVSAAEHTWPPSDDLARLQALRVDFDALMLRYRAAIEEVLTKVRILDDEFRFQNSYNPIEHISSRLKTPESILGKLRRKGLELAVASIRESLTDVAGIRVTCSFVSDVYRLLDLLSAHDDLRVLEVEDYIASPKPNGYRSLQALVEVPVFLSGGPEPVVVELQIRTIAMDFWASLEHKIYYKYDGAVPSDLVDQLWQAAETAARLDGEMERLHDQVHRQPLRRDLPPS